MKLYEVVAAANKKVLVKTQRLLDLKRYYISMYRHYMVRMYDSSYIDDPTKLDGCQIRRNILDLGIKGLKDISGSVQLSTEQLQYAIYKNSNTGEDTINFLQNLYQIVKYRSYSQDIDALYDTFDFADNTKQKVSLDLKMVGPLVETLKPFRISKAVLNCLLPINKTVGTTSLNEKIWEVAMKELGIPEEDWLKPGLFDKALSHKEEVECCKILFEGKVELDGKYADVMTTWLRSHKWLERGMSNTRKGLFDYIFSAYSEEMYNYECYIFSKLVDEGKRILAVSGSTVFFEQDMDEFKLPIGYFTIESGEDDREMYFGNAVNGFTGEVYSKEYLEEEGIMYVGCPIELNVGIREKHLYYDIEQVDLLCDSWFKSSGIEWEFDEREEYSFDKYPEDSLEHQIYDLYKKAQFGEPVGCITCLASSKALEDAKKNIMKCIKE